MIMYQILCIRPWKFQFKTLIDNMDFKKKNLEKLG